jgi:glycosyltransferase involved in cell wall biosynthesis
LNKLFRSHTHHLTSKHLHIVCLDVPYPADYGGVFDLFYKIKALHEAGINVHLHCFEYGRGKQQQLNQFCYSVNYYARKPFTKSFPFRLPHIVSSRSDSSLLKNLLQDDFPVLLEGIHCTYFLHSGGLDRKKIFVRLHNIEYDYYDELSKATDNFFKKTYFKWESLLLKKYETSISNKAVFIAVSQKDKEIYQQKLAAKRIEYIPVFLPFTKVNSEPGRGNFCLYHGNLSVPENEKAALWLLENVFNDSDLPFVIAGKNPSKHFEAKVRNNENVCIVANPSAQEMDDLIHKAQLNILPSFNKTGIKIKLLNALFNGKQIITNTNCVDGTGLEDLCSVANSAEEFKDETKRLFNTALNESEILKRKKVLEKNYNNETNAEKLIQLIW